MKKIKSYLMVALLGLSVSSCEDFLTLMPLNQVASTFAPGSVFKTLTLQAALSELPDAATRLYECTGSAKVGDNTVTCPKAHGKP